MKYCTVQPVGSILARTDVISVRPRSDAVVRLGEPVKTDALCVLDHLITEQLQEAQLKEKLRRQEEDIISKRMSYLKRKQSQGVLE
jgi:hypothetical protein